MLSENAEQARHSALLELQRVQREQVERLNQQLNENNHVLKSIRVKILNEKNKTRTDRNRAQSRRGEDACGEKVPRAF